VNAYIQKPLSRMSSAL